MAAQWLGLGYNIPPTPSRNRVYIWRKLREFGAEYFRSGVAVLPNTPENLENFRRLAKRIGEMAGEATLIALDFLDEKDETELIDRFRKQTEGEYQQLLEEAEELLRQQRAQPLTNEAGSRLKRLQRQLMRVRGREHFAGGLTQELESGFSQLIEALRGTAGDFSNQLRQSILENREKK